MSAFFIVCVWKKYILITSFLLGNEGGEEEEEWENGQECV